MMKLPLLLVGACLVGLAPARAQDLQATLDWVRRAELGTVVSGRVTEVAARPGASFAAGAELLRLDPREHQARVAEAEALVAKARVHFEEAEREDRRAAELYDRTVLSDHERQLAAIALQGARSDLQAARARLDRARLDLEHSVLRAPYAAVVLRVDAVPGQVVVSELQSSPLVVVAEDGRMLARGRAAAPVLGGLRVGAAARVEVRGTGYAGRVAVLGLEPLAGTGSEPQYEVAVVFEAPGEPRLRAGEAAVVRLDAAP